VQRDEGGVKSKGEERKLPGAGARDEGGGKYTKTFTRSISNKNIHTEKNIGGGGSL